MGEHILDIPEDEFYVILDKFVEDRETTTQPGDITRKMIQERYKDKGCTYDEARRIYDEFKAAHPEYIEVEVRINKRNHLALRKPVSSVT